MNCLQLRMRIKRILRRLYPGILQNYRRNKRLRSKATATGGISNCNVMQWMNQLGETQRESERERERERDKRPTGWRTRRRDATRGRGGWRTEKRRGDPRTNDKECRSQKVTRISFDEITWRLRVGTVIAFRCI